MRVRGLSQHLYLQTDGRSPLLQRSYCSDVSWTDGTGTLQLAARVAVPSTERPAEIGHWSKNQGYGVGRLGWGSEKEGQLRLGAFIAFIALLALFCRRYEICPVSPFQVAGIRAIRTVSKHNSTLVNRGDGPWVRSWSLGVAPTSDRLLAAKRNHRVDRKGPARGNQAGERGDRNEERRYGQDHDRIMRAIFDPASNDAVQS